MTTLGAIVRSRIVAAARSPRSASAAVRDSVSAGGSGASAGEARPIPLAPIIIGRSSAIASSSDGVRPVPGRMAIPSSSTGGGVPGRRSVPASPS